MAQGLRPSVIEAMARELVVRRDYLTETPQTIYFGGGTPSAVPLSDIASLFELSRSTFGVSSFAEATIECNPDDITPEYALGLREVGFNRVSLGVQSFVDDHLRLMNRRHDGAQAQRAVEILQQAGFNNITIDLIYAMPFLSDEQWSYNLSRALALGVQHISAYHLTLEGRTQFVRGGMVAVEGDVSQRHFDMLRSALLGGGFEHYEISNFALSGYRARHNTGYWLGEHYLGIGPSAHSFDGVSRCWNVCSNREYVDGRAAEVEILSATDRYNERLLTGLRMSDGVGDVDGALLDRASGFLASGDLVYDGSRLHIPSSRFLISDYIISSLFV